MAGRISTALTNRQYAWSMGCHSGLIGESNH